MNSTVGQVLAASLAGAAATNYNTQAATLGIKSNAPGDFFCNVLRFFVVRPRNKNKTKTKAKAHGVVWFG